MKYWSRNIFFVKCQKQNLHFTWISSAFFKNSPFAFVHGRKKAIWVWNDMTQVMNDRNVIISWIEWDLCLHIHEAFSPWLMCRVIVAYPSISDYSFVDVSMLCVLLPHARTSQITWQGMKQDVTLACPKKWPEESTRASLLVCADVSGHEREIGPAISLYWRGLFTALGKRQSFT